MPSLRDEITKTLVRFTRAMESRTHAGPKPSLPAGPDRRETRQYGTYRIIRRLGAGGMGDVYLALDTRLGRHVALKFLSSHLTSDPGFLMRFQQEARTASALNHPNIVTIYDFTEIDGESILVSEFIEGATLRTVLDRGALTLSDAVHIGIQISSALATAHAAGIIHRDLKPSNIMIRPDGYIKVIDFGLAKRSSGRDSRSSITLASQHGHVVGTVDYMSPEQARGLSLDGRTDVWSLGVILYEFATGHRPFQGETDSHVIVGILDQNPLPLAVLPAEGPAGLAQVIQRALEKDRSKRYATAQEMLLELQRVQRQSTTDVTLPKLVRAPRRPWRLLIPSISFFVILSAFCLWWWGWYGREKILGPRWFDFASTRRVTFDGDVMDAAISPDGKYIAYVRGSKGNQTLQRMDLNSTSVTRVGATAGQYMGLAFSPDSKDLFYVVRDAEREIGRLYTTPTVRRAEEPSKLILEHIDGPPAFSPDGHSFAYVRVVRGPDRSYNEIWLTSDSDSSNPHRFVSLLGTQILEQLAWLPRQHDLVAITYPAHLKAATVGHISMIDRKGNLTSRPAPANIRSLFLPVAIDKGSLLLFSGTPQGAIERHLVQLFVPTGEFHDTPTDVAGLDNISATTDGKILSSVRVDQRSSVWVANADRLQDGQKIARDSEHVLQVDWTDDGNLVFPSARTGNVNLAKLSMDGSINAVIASQDCVQNFPKVVPGKNLIVYSANCAHGGDDFNIWTLDTKTGKRRQLTSGSSYDYQPDPTPDGKWIVYTSWTSNVPSIWKLPADGSGLPIRLTRTQGRLPYVSPDGTRVVCQIQETGSRWQVAILNLADGAVLQTFPQLPVLGVLRWSPDGKALDYTRVTPGARGIWRQPLAGGAPRQLIPIPEDEVNFFAWNREGTRIAYVVSRQQRDVVLLHRRTERF